ncbi:OLC1v1027882C1 [Oldenlandia corymbosa var. corymbosa]|uniref:OLC1v1027882C1 n=1 Tax=Oldenlandia corymbosa var. corymbosa TaxID=529605 RepID=A0AAV1CBM1_OLDCO|nr:OLC1v1027882C1 [Oldenlandia corymbosa var. corymbosa]
MADVVQYKLERMLNELDDLEQRGLFNRREIAEIVKQRRKFEYRLKRPSPLKEDFVAYIDYEKRLDELRLLRKKAMLKQSGGKTKNWKKSVSDYAGTARIVDIYRLATTRFKGDIQLWFQYLEFCRQKRNGRMKKALAQVIRFHPKVPGVWIYAAAWEFDHNLNAAAARALMQRGLRACPNSEDLWVEYLRMELTYLNKLKARKVALGEDDGTLVRNAKDNAEMQWRNENGELFMGLDDKNADEKSNEDVDLLRKQGLSIFQTIYSGAIEAHPSSFGLRIRFLEILDATDLAQSDSMRDEILADLQRDFSKEPEYWDWLARREIADLKKSVEVYEEGLRVLSSVPLFNFYVKFLVDAISHKFSDTQTSADSGECGQLTDPVFHLLRVYEKAENLGLLSEDLVCQHVTLLLELRKLDEGKKICEKFCSGMFSYSVPLWTLYISINMRCLDKPSKDNLSSLFDLLKNVLTEVASSKSEALWLMAFKYFAHHRSYFEKLIEVSMVSLAKHGGSDNGFSLSSTIVDQVLQRDGIQRAREIYKRLLKLPHPGLVMYKTCVELESNLASAGNKECIENARKLFESAISTYSGDSNLWSEYYSMELKMGTSEKAAAVLWRARKVLGFNIALSSPDL